MPGGVLNIISFGNQNIILNGNPTKSFFKSTYMKYTNFGLQRFRINHEGLRNIDTINDTQYTFKVPRYGDLLMDTYLVISLPHIWSSVYKISTTDNQGNVKYTYIPYEFKWVEEIGTHIIKNIRIRCGNSLLQEYTGEYISVCAKRDYKKEELEKFNVMIGNTPELNDPSLPFLNISPALIRGVVGYPSAFFDKTSLTGGGPEPSIRGRKLYVPINAWFCNTSKMPFPLISCQNSELFIDITLRPLKELFVIRDVSNFYQNKLNSLSYQISSSTQGDLIVNDEIIKTNFFVNTEKLNLCDTSKNGLIYTSNVVDDDRRIIEVSIYDNGLKTDTIIIEYGNYTTYDGTINNSTFISNTINELKSYFLDNPGINEPIADINAFLESINIINTTDSSYIINIDYEHYEYTSVGLLTIQKEVVIDSNNAINGMTIDTITNIIQREESYSYNDVYSVVSQTVLVQNKNNTDDVTVVEDDIIFFDPPITLENNTFQTCFLPSFVESVENMMNVNNTNSEFLTEYPYIQPNFNLPEHAMYRFLHPPPNTELDYTNADKRILFNSDVHLIGTFGFLTEEEGRELASKEQSYLIKDVREYTFHDIVGNKKVDLESTGLINNWTFFLRRNDAFLRNEWNNYSNWKYKYFKPQKVIDTNSIITLYENEDMLYDPAIIGRSLFDFNTTDANGDFFAPPPLEYFSSGSFNIQNEKKILKRFGIYLDGKIREDVFDSGIYHYIEPFQRAGGAHAENLYFYNFGIDSFRGATQPSGAINMSKFTKIELELETEIPPLDPDAQFYTVCSTLDEPQLNGTNGQGTQIVGVNKETFRLYKYTYDLRLFEEKYNIVNFSSGVCGLMFTR